MTVGHPGTVRVMTYNIWMGGRRGQPLHDVVRAAAVDVLLVNETPKVPVVGERRCRRLCAAWGLHLVSGGRSAGSNLVAVSARVEVVAGGAHRLRQPVGQPRRGVAWAQLSVTGAHLGVVSCHLSLDPARRLQEVEDVLAVAARLSGPVLVGGDLNEPPGGRVWRRLAAAGFRDHGDDGWSTFPADAPRARIDALLVRGAAEVSSHGDPGVPRALMAAASDHLPVLAVLRV
jgi:endonuclease/exonuclease/phosphatase family metal-dependent hydrolase